ncbi:hypothetical protein JMJ35_005618 [Cladonia borealis]|uniref:Uncharacterized protein n=1 Tax=Cladonia borealis TaxID=184061 RepID=A0AA39V8D9_9LECA|nr:hypothetical protein JMJ35_005618 [Cladonia borealis]
MPSRKGVMRCVERMKKSLMDCFSPCRDSSGSPPRLVISKPSNFVKLDEPFACMLELSEEDASFMKEEYAASNGTLSQQPPLSGQITRASLPGKRTVSTATFRYDAEAQVVGDVLSSPTILVPSQITWAA